MRTLFSLALALICVRPVLAQTPPSTTEPAHDVDSLAKQTQNPVSDLTSVPLQFNFNTGGDLDDRTMLNLNFQPVIPFKASTNWNVIARTIVPLNSIPGPEGTRYSGVGDIQMQIFVSPAKPGAIIWGVGPIFSLPTATALGAETGTWAAGPTAVVLKMTGPWVLGGLISQLWPLSDEAGDPETDLFLVQPFVNYNFSHGWALAFAPIITANWNADDGNEWTVPLGFGFSRTTVFNRRPMSLGVQYLLQRRAPGRRGGPATPLLGFVPVSALMNRAHSGLDGSTRRGMYGCTRGRCAVEAFNRDDMDRPCDHRCAARAWLFLVRHIVAGQ